MASLKTFLKVPSSSTLKSVKSKGSQMWWRMNSLIISSVIQQRLNPPRESGMEAAYVCNFLLTCRWLQLSLLPVRSHLPPDGTWRWDTPLRTPGSLRCLLQQLETAPPEGRGCWSHDLQSDWTRRCAETKPGDREEQTQALDPVQIMKTKVY